MSERKDIEMAEDLIHRYKMAIESIKQVVRPEPDKIERLYYLDSVIKENETTNKPKLEAYLKLEEKDPKQEKEVLKAEKELEDLIQKVKNS